MDGMDPVAVFTELVGRVDVPLDRAVLAIAAGAEPLVDTERWLGVLDELADGVDSFDALRHRLFVERKFTGNTADYADPRNSLLPHVLARRLGIPITLAVVAIEVGRRAGVVLDGVGMPGHFLVGVPGRDTYLDAFAGGELLDVDGCERRFRAVTGGRLDIEFGPGLLRPTPTPAILVRMLENLRGVFRERRRPGDLEWVLRMRLALPAATLTHLVELADALGAQARWDEGARLLVEHAEAAAPPQAAQLHLRARSLLANLN